MIKQLLFIPILLLSMYSQAQEIGIHRSFFHYGGEDGSGYNAIGLYFGKSFIVKGKESKAQWIIKPQLFGGYWYESKSNKSGYVKYTFDEPRFTAGGAASFLYARKGQKNIFLAGFTAGFFEVPGVFGPTLGYYRKIGPLWAVGANLVSSGAPGSYSTSFVSFNLGISKNLF